MIKYFMLVNSVILIVLITSDVQAATPKCEMPASIKAVGVECMNGGARTKKDIMTCAWNKLGVINNDNQFMVVKAFAVGSAVVIHEEGGMERAIEGTLNCYQQFGGVGQGTEAIDCMMAVFKEVCNI